MEGSGQHQYAQLETVTTKYGRRERRLAMRVRLLLLTLTIIGWSVWGWWSLQ